MVKQDNVDLDTLNLERYIQKAHSSGGNHCVSHVEGESTNKQIWVIFFILPLKKKWRSFDPHDGKGNSMHTTRVLMQLSL